MHDWFCWPLWDCDVPGNIDPDTLPLSDGLRLALRTWQDQYDAHLNRYDPKEPPWDMPEGTPSVADLDRQAVELWLALREEFEDAEVEVGYQRGRRLIWRPRELPSDWVAS